MLSVGDVHVYASDFHLALRFWEAGLGLRVVESEVGQTTAYAVLEFPDGGSALRLFGGAEAWPEDSRPDVGSRPTVRFDILTSDLESTIVRLIAHGGRQIGEIERYNGSRVATLADPDGNTFELLDVPDNNE